MSFLQNLFGRKPVRAGGTAQTQEEMRAECPHTALMGRWDSVADMGKDEKATAFICDSCQMSFTPEEGRLLRDSARERLHIDEVEHARQRVDEAEREASSH